MKSNHTDITIVLDRSGSMQSVATDTIGGFNKFLADQQAAPGTAAITLNQFDDKYERIIDAKPIAEAKPLDGTTFVPRGSTALLDAIGKSIEDTGKRLEGTPENDRPSKVVCVIITDGHENASHRFSRQQIDAMIREQRDKWQWEFVFLGANQDAIATAASMGIPAAAAMSYAGNAAGTTAAYASVSRAMSMMRSGGAKGMAFSDEDRKKQRQAGATH